jgi:hypothetical protein
MAIQSVSQPIGKIINFRKSPTIEVDNWISHSAGPEGAYNIISYGGKLYTCTNQGAIYVYNGVSWSLSYYSGSNSVYSLCIYDGKLYAGGFYPANVYVFDGTSWSVSKADGHWGLAYSMAVYSGKLYVGTDEGGTIYVFNGTSWSVSVITGSSNHRVESMAVFNNKLYAGTNARLWMKDGDAGWVIIEDLNRHYGDLVVYNGKMYCGIEQYIQSYDGVSWTYCVANNHNVRSTIYANKLYMSESNNNVIHVLSDGVWSQFTMDYGVGSFVSFTVMSGVLYAAVVQSGNIYSLTLSAGTFQSISQPIGDVIRLRRNENNVPKEATGNTVSQPIGHTGIRLRRNFSNVPGE